MTKQTKQGGKAYAFFDCDASKVQIEAELPQIREDARTPTGLNLKLSQGIAGLKLEKELLDPLSFPADYRVMSKERLATAREERRPLSSMKYALVAEYDQMDNKQVAGELGDVVNNIHLRYNKDTGFFRGAIVYKDNAEYVLRE